MDRKEALEILVALVNLVFLEPEVSLDALVMLELKEKSERLVPLVKMAALDHLGLWELVVSLE